MPKYTLTDAAKLHAAEPLQEIISEVAQLTPELGVYPLNVIDKTTYTALVRTANPTVGFRHMNQGVSDSKATFAPKIFQAFSLDHQVKLDRAMKEDLGEAGFGRLMAEHTAGAMEAAFATISKQIYYGNPEADKGFPGLLEQYSADSDHEVNVTGSNNKFSVWMVNASLGNSALISGGGRQALFEQGPWELKDLTDDDGNVYQGFASWLYGSVGFELKNKHAAVRAKNVSNSDSGKGVTDLVLNEMYTKFIRNGNRPNAIFMPPEGVELLRKSRTATNPTGEPAPRPTDWNGIPIYETSGIVIGASGE